MRYFSIMFVKCTSYIYIWILLLQYNINIHTDTPYCLLRQVDEVEVLSLPCPPYRYIKHICMPMCPCIDIQIDIVRYCPHELIIYHERQTVTQTQSYTHVGSVIRAYIYIKYNNLNLNFNLNLEIWINLSNSDWFWCDSHSIVKVGNWKLRMTHIYYNYWSAPRE